MPKFRKKPVVIEAVQLCWVNWEKICDFLGSIISEENPARDVAGFSDTCGEDGPMYIELTIPTLGGAHIAKHGDFIIKGVQGEFYPCKPDIFEQTYGEVVFPLVGIAKVKVEYDGGLIDMKLDDAIKEFFEARGFELSGTGMMLINGIRDIGFHRET